MADISIKGADALKKALQERMKLEAVKQTVKINSDRLHNKILRSTSKNVTFTKGYSMGQIRQDVASRMPEYSDGGLTSKQGTVKDYAPYLITGTRFMEAENFMEVPIRRSTEEFQRDMRKIFK